MKAVRIAVALLALWQAGQAGMAQAQTPGATQARPPQDQCPAVADIDLRAMARTAARERREAEQRLAAQGRPSLDAIAAGMLGPVRVADWAENRPPADAPVVIRARMPAGGGYSTDHRAMVWRDQDGVWWFWRQVLGGPPAMPAPPLPPGVQEGSPEWEAWKATQPRPGASVEDISYPPVEGRLSPGRAAQLEAAWRDPCRNWDPDYWPYEIPLNRRIDGSRTRRCAQDSSGIWGEITENGAAPRRVGGACINSSPTYRMIEIATYAGPEDPT